MGSPSAYHSGMEQALSGTSGGNAKLIVVGGDDAEWIDKGTEVVPYVLRQLSGFHYSRSCSRGWKNGKDIYDTIRSGAIWIGEAGEREGKTARKWREYVVKRLKKGVDWRKKAESMGLKIRRYGGKSVQSVCRQDERPWHELGYQWSTPYGQSHPVGSQWTPETVVR